MRLEAMSDQGILEELGRRLRRERLNRNMKQTVLAEKAGVSRRALQKLEAGEAGSLDLLIRVLRALGKLDALDAVLPEPGPSPIQLARMQGRERQRASDRKGKLDGGHR